MYFQWFHGFVFKYIIPLCLPVVRHSLQSKKKECLIWRPCPSMYLWLSSSAYTVCQIFLKLGIGAVYRKLLSRCECSENQLTDSRTLLNDVSECVHTLPYFLSDLGEIWYKRSPSNAIKHLQVL